MTRSEHLYAIADRAREAARICARAAAAAALTVIAAAIAHAAGGVALALAIIGAFLLRRIAWDRLERSERAQALAQELWESFQRSNWRERTGWSRLTPERRIWTRVARERTGWSRVA